MYVFIYLLSVNFFEQDNCYNNVENAMVRHSTQMVALYRHFYKVQTPIQAIYAFTKYLVHKIIKF